MEQILTDIVWCKCVYLDNIVAFDRMFMDALMNLWMVLERLSAENLKLKLKKCEFVRKEVEYLNLGHNISKKGINPSPNKVATLQGWSPPQHVSEVRIFLGFRGYYLCYIDWYSNITAPLIRMLHTAYKYRV